MIRRSFLAGVLLFALLAGGGVALLDEFATFLLFTPPRPVTLIIPMGTSFSTIAAQLEDEQVVTSAWWLEFYARIINRGGGVRAGEYRFAPGDPPELILDRLRRGLVVRHRVVIPEGWNLREVAKQFRTKGLSLGERAFEMTAYRGLVGEGVTSLEGWLFPDTYEYRLEEQGEAILMRMVERTRRILKEEWLARSPAVTLDPYQTLILASIVEKETGVAAERPRIAGVFQNRLARGMKLQTDPTVIYGIPDFDGNLTRRHLETPTPYNTYTIPGLPPTPIGNPGREAIHAVLHPETTRALYFVSRGDGTHAFSETLEEHNRYVKQYQKKGK